MVEIAQPKLVSMMEQYAKDNAPWQDQTGAARSGLTGGFVNSGKGSFTLSIAHGVDYGIYLEMANSGRYAILEPTVRAMLPTVIEELKEAWRNIKI
jgi:hypothetical protein